MTDKENINETVQAEENGEVSTIFSAPAEPVKPLTKRQRESAAKKQLKTIVALVVAAVAALCLYFFVVVPIVNYVEEIVKDPIELLDGEVLGTNDRILLFEHFERKDIQAIDVHNEHGEYGFYYNSKDEAFYVKDHEYATFDKELFSSLVVNAGYALSIERVTTDCEDLSEYGLADEQNPAYYTVTTRPDADGNSESHTVYVGDLIPTGGGYYVRYAGRNAVYILDADLASTILAPIEDLITPMLTLPMSQNDYFMIKNFIVADSEEPIVAITFLEEEEKNALAMTSAYRMLYPSNYSVNSSNYSEVLQVLTNFTGLRTVALAPTEEEIEEYGLAEPAFSISYNYQGIEQTVIFSEKNENGNYYAGSLLFNIIAELDGETMKWLEWGLIDWVDPPIFMMNINNVATITLESDTATRTFDLVGDGQELVVTERETGFKPVVQNFRQFYKTLLSINLQGYVTGDMSESDAEALTVSDKPYLALAIETRAGQKTEYKFYPYSTRRAYYTVNGSGEFYVLRDMVTKVISDGEKVMTNTDIDSEAHS